MITLLAQTLAPALHENSNLQYYMWPKQIYSVFTSHCQGPYSLGFILSAFQKLHSRAKSARSGHNLQVVICCSCIKSMHAGIQWCIFCCELTSFWLSLSCQCVLLSKSITCVQTQPFKSQWPSSFFLPVSKAFMLNHLLFLYTWTFTECILNIFHHPFYHH